MDVTSLLLFALLQSPEIRSTAADRTELGLTLYHGGYAMVRERRTIDLPEGMIRLALEEVAATIEPKTVQFRVLAGAPVRIQERNYDFNLLSPENLVKNSLGARILAPNQLEGGTPIAAVLASLPTPDIYAPPRTPMEAKLDPMPPMERLARIYRGRFAKRRLVGRDPDVVIQLQDGFTVLPPGRLAFTHRPEALRPTPTLLMELESGAPGTRSMDVAYLAKGLTWHATYVATMDRLGNTLDLDAFVTLTNESGTAFPNSHLQLLAGEPNRVPDPESEAVDPDRARLDGTSVMVAASVNPFSTERIGDNQLFTLGRPTSLEAGQTKQVALFSAPRIPIERRNILGISAHDRMPSGRLEEYQNPNLNNPLFHWTPCDSHQSRIQFVNRRSQGIGRPLPQGQIYVYYLDRSGHPVPLFEDWFQETPEGEVAEINLGPIAGLSGQWRWAEVKHGYWFRRNTQRATLEIKIISDRRNAEPVEIHALVGADWDLLTASHRGIRERSDMMVFLIPPVIGETIMRATFLVPNPIP